MKTWNTFLCNYHYLYLFCILSGCLWLSSVQWRCQVCSGCWGKFCTRLPTHPDLVPLVLRVQTLGWPDDQCPISNAYSWSCLPYWLVGLEYWWLLAEREVSEWLCCGILELGYLMTLFSSVFSQTVALVPLMVMSGSTQKTPRLLPFGSEPSNKTNSGRNHGSGVIALSSLWFLHPWKALPSTLSLLSVYVVLHLACQSRSNWWWNPCQLLLCYFQYMDCLK